MVYTYKIDEQTSMDFQTGDNVFTPTGTSLALIRAFKQLKGKPAKTLDLGCGSGIVGLVGFQAGLVEPPLYASDLSPDAVSCAMENGRRSGCLVVGKVGSLFEPWAGETFDIILDDVSGIAEEVAKVSPWFQNVPCNAGVDGTDLVNAVIEQAPEHLNKGGTLLFPIISLSNEGKILARAKKHFSKVERLIHEEWPLPKEMYAQMNLLDRLSSEGHIAAKKKFGMVVLSTDIYSASN